MWQKSGKSWRDRLSGYQPYPAELQTVEPNSSRWDKPDVEHSAFHRTLHSGGRLSKNVILIHAEQIDKFFGMEVANLIDPKRTLILT